MPRLVIALLVGALLGAAVFLFVRRESVEPAALGVAATPKPDAPSSEPDELKANFVSATHPGLVVHVLRGGAAEPGARVELSSAARSLVTSKLVWEPAGLEKTSPEGRASFPAMAGRYFVIATASDGARALEAVDVSWAASSTLVTLTIAAAKKFSGRVIDFATHQPLAGAIVRADPQEVAEGLEPTVPAASAGRRWPPASSPPPGGQARATWPTPPPAAPARRACPAARWDRWAAASRRSGRAPRRPRAGSAVRRAARAAP